MNNGDFLKIDYEVRAGEEKKLVDTSIETLAKENDIYHEHRKYGDEVIIVGSDKQFPEINESLEKSEEGKEFEVVIPAEKAYGLRDNKNIKVHTVREFQRQELNPVVGQEITLNNRRGKILSVTPGRVLVDYNHPLAGKTIYYKYKVREVIKDSAEKLLSIIHMYYQTEKEDFTCSAEDGNAIINVPEDAKFDPVWLNAKYLVVNDIRKYLPEDDVSIRELYKKSPKEEEHKEETKETAEEIKEVPETKEETPQ
ncbi:Putative FKBP-type peptidyl-prolyl cis-trans isomerase [Thermoplasmatales archaeon]|nr:Putative FKBP-type peptidyl-prolyl cis-trans isomerase [Thermoplasmatales archaeon]